MMSSVERLNSVSIPAIGKEIGERIEKARTTRRPEDILFMQALFRYDIEHCASDAKKRGKEEKRRKYSYHRIYGHNFK